MKTLVSLRTEIPVISEELLTGINAEEIGKVHLQHVVRDDMLTRLFKVKSRV